MSVAVHLEPQNIEIEVVEVAEVATAAAAAAAEDVIVEREEHAAERVSWEYEQGV